MKSIDTYAEMAQTAVREPDKVPSYLQLKSKQLLMDPGRRWATKAQTAGLDGQVDQLDALRASDEYLLIVLDACRFDYLEDVFDDWFRGDLKPVRSAGRDTFEYVRLCWPDQHDITYLSGATPINAADIDYEIDAFNELYGGYEPTEHINEIVDVWDSGWDESLGTCPPWEVTDATLERLDEDQLVAHYFQPHAPYIGRDCQFLGHNKTENARPHAGEPIDKPIWEAIRYGDATQEDLREAYAANLKCALREVARLVDEAPHDNIVIMGDHGEALGEWGVYSHPRTEHPHIRRVPWATVDGLTDYASDELAEAGGDWADGVETDGSVATRLEQLGYI